MSDSNSPWMSVSGNHHTMPNSCICPGGKKIDLRNLGCPTGKLSRKKGGPDLAKLAEIYRR